MTGQWTEYKTLLGDFQQGLSPGKGPCPISRGCQAGSCSSYSSVADEEEARGGNSGRTARGRCSVICRVFLFFFFFFSFFFFAFSFLSFLFFSLPLSGYFIMILGGKEKNKY